jgi:predicted DNA-binding transcriptional regulator YafY
MRADRLLSILLLLQEHGRLSARNLSRRLEVSPRTIYRDMDALSGAGIPVLAERGSGGGWTLLDDYRTKLTALTTAEIQTLVLARPSRLLADLGLHQAAEAALLKLLAALPDVVRRDAEYARQRIHVDPTGWNDSEENVTALPILQEAVWQERKLHLTYRRRDEAPVERTVNPLGLVAKGRIWYLVGTVDGAPRTYRVSRIEEARIADEAAVRPPEFDLAAFWGQSSADFAAALPRYPVQVRMDAGSLPMLRFLGRYIHVLRAEPADDDGWLNLELEFNSEEDACRHLLGFGPRVEILEPRALRERVATLAAAVVALYARESANIAGA